MAPSSQLSHMDRYILFVFNLGCDCLRTSSVHVFISQAIDQGERLYWSVERKVFYGRNVYMRICVSDCWSKQGSWSGNMLHYTKKKSGCKQWLGLLSQWKQQYFDVFYLFETGNDHDYDGDKIVIFLLNKVHLWLNSGNRADASWFPAPTPSCVPFFTKV